jgi:hypothetical protein
LAQVAVYAILYSSRTFHAKDASLPIRLLVTVCLILGMPLAACGMRVQTYVYDFQVGPNHREVSMQVESDGQQTVVTYHNEFDDQEITTFDPDVRPVKVKYVNSAGEETASVLYDYAKKTVTIRGLIQAQYRLLPQTYDNNGSLFYLFGQRYPTAGKDFIFYLVQSNLSHVNDPLLRLLVSQLLGPVQMDLKYRGQENVEILGQTYAAELYALGIHDARLATFWPNQYQFWFQTQERRLVKYQGLNADRKIGTVLLVDYYERSFPTPELPTL